MGRKGARRSAVPGRAASAPPACSALAASSRPPGSVCAARSPYAAGQRRGEGAWLSSPKVLGPESPMKRGSAVMSWVRLDDQYPDHPKVRALGPLGLALQTAAICYCGRYLTDGFLGFPSDRK